MKRILIIALLALFAVNLSAQKSVRRSIRRGNSAFKEQRYSAAETDYAKALEENASSKEASFNLANTFYKQQRFDEAINEYQHYLTLENETPEKMGSAWSNIGNSFLKKKAAEKHEAQSQGGEPKQQGGKQQDNLQMSMEAYKNALRLNPQDDDTRENLAIVQKMIKDEEGGGGGGDDDDQEQNQDQKQDEKQDQQDQKDQSQDQKDQQQDENQMSQENIQQILEAIEQDERRTQEKVNQEKAEERKRQSEKNRRQDKDW